MKAYHTAKIEDIDCFEIANENGMRVQLISFGARISKLIVPSKMGAIDVVAGFENPTEFKKENPYFNAVVGRVGNRIRGAQFWLDGKQYKLFANDGCNHLHGGKVGFDSRLWQGEVVGDSVRFVRTSTDMEEGYPGNLQVCVTYSLDNDNALHIAYKATTDKDTPCSLTNHAYFNLSGEFDSVLQHEVCIKSHALTAVDTTLAATGEIVNIEGSVYDFCTPKQIGKDIGADEFLLKVANGYDFNYILDEHTPNDVVATAYCEKSGVKMSVYTDRACMQFYSGNFLDGIVGKKTYNFRSAFCMETQGYIDACNQPSFPSNVLRAGEVFESCTRYKFDIV